MKAESGVYAELRAARGMLPPRIRRRLPSSARRALATLYWRANDTRDFMAEAIGWLPSHALRLLLYRRLLRVQIGRGSSLHRNCRLYYPRGIALGDHTVVNRDVLLDGRMGLSIGSNVSISEGAALFSLEHDPNGAMFDERGGPVVLADYVFVGARAIILPGVRVERGAVVAAGAVVTRDVAPFTIVGGVPARRIGARREDLAYNLTYRKFLG